MRKIVAQKTMREELMQANPMQISGVLIIWLLAIGVGYVSSSNALYRGIVSATLGGVVVVSFRGFGMRQLKEVSRSLAEAQKILGKATEQLWYCTRRIPELETELSVMTPADEKRPAIENFGIKIDNVVSETVSDVANVVKNVVGLGLAVWGLSENSHVASHVGTSLYEANGMRSRKKDLIKSRKEEVQEKLKMNREIIKAMEKIISEKKNEIKTCEIKKSEYENSLCFWNSLLWQGVPAVGAIIASMLS